MGRHNIPRNGDVFSTRFHGDVVVVDYQSSKHILIKFLDGNFKVVATKELRNGVIKNNFHPEVYGVGCIGEGRFSSGIVGGRGPSQEYKIWSGILRRCYDPEFQLKHTSYKDCYVQEDWLNFQNFAEWLVSQKGYNDGWHVDKDILLRGNKCYSPDTCVLVPQEVNNLLTLRKSKRGVLPLGVTKSKSGRYNSTMHGMNGSTHLGTYDTPYLAFNAYKIHKEAHIRCVIDKYKDQLPETVYNALANYNISSED